MLIESGVVLDGCYRVGAKLGEGAMGAVYEATHIAGGEVVAIKVLHRCYARDEEVIRRFAREARAAADIAHPAVVDVLGGGTHLGMPYLVMTLLRGETLARKLERLKRLPPAEACEIVGHVLSALASAHARGIIHRDLKPENVFLEGAWERPRVRLLDFGISKFRPPFAALGPSTLEGTIMGTPGYMAPEQWMGRRDIDHRADLFAVGAILYQLLCGRVPYGNAKQSEFFLEVVRGTHPPEAPGRSVPGVAAELDRVVLRALDRDRDRRYSCAREFLDALRPFGAASIAAVSLSPAPVLSDDAGSLAPPPPRRVRRRDPHRYWLVPLLTGAIVSFVVTVSIWRPPAHPGCAGQVQVWIATAQRRALVASLLRPQRVAHVLLSAVAVAELVIFDRSPGVTCGAFGGERSRDATHDGTTDPTPLPSGAGGEPRRVCGRRAPPGTPCRRRLPADHRLGAAHGVRPALRQLRVSRRPQPDLRTRPGLPGPRRTCDRRGVGRL